MATCHFNDETQTKMKNLTTKKVELTFGGCQWGDCAGTFPFGTTITIYGQTIFLPVVVLPHY